MKTLNLKGQHTALKMLTSYTSENIPPLLIFHGPEGVGKMFSAESFIQTHLCKVGTSCGSCSSCKKIMKGEHPDFIVFPETKVGIGDEKEPEEFSIRWLLRKRVIYNPHEGNLRFILFPRADLILHEAETALLKTLEEPPEHTRFIFIIRDLDELKATVLSRGVSIPFYRLSHEDTMHVTGTNDPEILDLLGGSLHLFSFFKSDLYPVMKEKIMEGLGHPLALSKLEQWLLSGEKNHFRDLLEPDSKVKYEDILDLFGLILLKECETHKKRKEISEILFEFKGDLHRDVPGLNPYLTGRFFHRLMEILFHPKSVRA